MSEEYDKLKNSLVLIASELFRFQQVFDKVIRRLELDEQVKYSRRFEYFSRRVSKALDDSNLRIISVDGQIYDPGMSVTPLNLEDFDRNDVLCIEKTMEPIIMEGDAVIKMGTVLLRRNEQ